MGILNKYFIILFFLPLIAFGQENKRIEDNSFLIEEAFNQEAHVVQHINVFQFNNDFSTLEASFTQEWPIGSQKHQVSYTIPYEANSTFALGNSLLNYRYQLLSNDRLSIAPRLSGILPTSKAINRFYGFEVNMPISWSLNNSFMVHFNALYNHSFAPPNSLSAQRTAIENCYRSILQNKERDIQLICAASPIKSTESFTTGVSLIYYASYHLNFLIESLYQRTSTYTENSDSIKDEQFIINPGARYAIDFKSGLQIVPGVSIPYNIKDSEIEGFLVYLSFEHPF